MIDKHNAGVIASWRRGRAANRRDSLGGDRVGDREF
jgi:hypothetical protein